MKSVNSLERFQAFIEERRCLGDWADYVSANLRKLSRVRLVEACGLRRSVIYQNAQIVTLLSELEAELRVLGVLTEFSADIHSASQDGLTHGEQFEQRMGELSASLCEFNAYLDDVSKSLESYPLSRPA